MKRKLTHPAPKLYPLEVMIVRPGSDPRYVKIPDPRERFIAAYNEATEGSGFYAQIHPLDALRSVVKRRKPKGGGH